ncbi:hypothetical protein HYU23_03145 [Candidatus Woesearchaeota archaeon]|nr:hypothetical protein [Candidatus Woesearchaeota archaeon]
MVMIKTKSPWIQDIKIKAIDLVDKEFIGNTPPTVFVGSKYINDKKVNVGILSPLDNKEEAWKYDNPYYWYKNDYSIKKVVELRANLINARKQANIFDVRSNNKFLELAQEIAMSSKTTSIEVELKKKLRPKLSIDKVHLPFGPGGEANKIEAIDNIKLEKKIEKVFYDTDLKAVDAIKFLKDKGLSEYQLSQLLSIGIMGIKRNRKLVPTRWSITATDDTIGKDCIKEIKNYNTIENYKLYFGNYFGNYYLILMFPDAWSYELFETALPDNLTRPDEIVYTTTDYENHYGRKDYADNTVGGYYAARLSLLEELKNLKKQASCLLLRYVTSEYSVPLGVFVVRQAVRKSLNSEKYEFANKKEMLDFAKSIIMKRFNYNIDAQLKNSKMLDKLNKQIKLSNFF